VVFSPPPPPPPHASLWLRPDTTSNDEQPD
jgi:hypothetical protein